MRFIPAEARPYLHVTPGLDRRLAARTLLGAFIRGRRLLTGAGLWIVLVVAVVAVTGGATAVAATAIEEEPLAAAVVGGLAVLCGAAAAVWAARRSVQLLQAGAHLSRVAEAWMASAPTPEPTLGHRVYELLSGLRPEIYPRVLLCGLAGLGTVLSASLVGYSLAGIGVVDDVTAVLSAATGLVGAALTVLCGVPAVALWRGARRIQHCLVKDVALLA